MKKPIRIGLAISHSYAHYRGILTGIRAYAETRPNWFFLFVVPTDPARRKFTGDPQGLIVSANTSPLLRPARVCAGRS
jgi:hypothetical protein